jgi:hypothetical protein
MKCIFKSTCGGDLKKKICQNVSKTVKSNLVDVHITLYHTLSTSLGGSGSGGGGGAVVVAVSTKCSILE